MKKGRYSNTKMRSSKTYCMDCMDYMRETPDKYFDLAVVDPPYGTGAITYIAHERKQAHGGTIDNFSITMAAHAVDMRKGVGTHHTHKRLSSKTRTRFADADTPPPPEYFSELFRVSKRQIIWGGNYFVLPPSRNFIIWHKTTVAESFSMAQAEYAWLSFDGNSRIWSGAPQGTKKDERIHPTQKPIALYSWIFDRYADKGDKILDTHIGSGSSRIAAWNSAKELEFVGIEIDQEYFDAQEARFARMTAQKTMWESTEK